MDAFLINRVLPRNTEAWVIVSNLFHHGPKHHYRHCLAWEICMVNATRDVGVVLFPVVFSTHLFGTMTPDLTLFPFVIRSVYNT